MRFAACVKQSATHFMHGVTALVVSAPIAKELDQSTYGNHFSLLKQAHVLVGRLCQAAV
jgi:hypothetical protein